MFDELKARVCAANLQLVESGLVLLTWGNASAIDRDKGVVVIKPSGVPYSAMTPDDMVVVDLDGNIVDGKMKPSSDTPTHLILYRSFPQLGGVAHTHSTFATAWAQACRPIENIGTTHADAFHTEVPVTDEIPSDDIRKEYELATGRTIVETFERLGIDPLETPAALAAHHGPFTWGTSVEQAVEHAIILEEVAKMAVISYGINPELWMNCNMIEKHYLRKHGPSAYYGQR